MSEPVRGVLASLAMAVLFNGPIGAWAQRAPSASADTFRLVTYNVLADPVHVEQRVPPLLGILEDAKADVIVLQEVAPWFARRLLSQPWTSTYHRYTRDGKTVVAHEHLILSRFPVLEAVTRILPGE